MEEAAGLFSGSPQWKQGASGGIPLGTGSGPIPEMPLAEVGWALQTPLAEVGWALQTPLAEVVQALHMPLAEVGRHFPGLQRLI